MKKVILIGCGGIGYTYDANQKNRSNISLTHVRTLQLLAPDFTCIACVDTDPTLAKEAASKLNCAYSFTSIEELRAARLEPDIVCIASPTHTHLNGLEYCLKSTANIVICEKPLTSSLETSRQITEKFNAQQKTIFINYFRLWDRQLIGLSRDIHDNKFGKLQSAHAAYVKGVLHNGPHMINLLRDLIGNVVVSQVDSKNNEGGTSGRLTALQHENAPLQVQALESSHYNFFEVTLFMEKAVIHIEDGGRRIRIRTPINHPDYPDFVYPEKIETLENTQGSALINLYKEVSNYLDYKVPPRRSSQWCVEGEVICHQLHTRSFLS